MGGLDWTDRKDEIMRDRRIEATVTWTCVHGASTDGVMESHVRAHMTARHAEQ